MKTFSDLLSRMNSETQFYCVKLNNVFGFKEKKIFVSTPLTYHELQMFTSRRTKNNPDAVTIVDAYYALTPTEKEEVYGLDSFAKLLDRINARITREYALTWYEDGEKRYCFTSDIDLVHKTMRDKDGASACVVTYDKVYAGYTKPLRPKGRE